MGEIIAVGGFILTLLGILFALRSDWRNQRYPGRIQFWLKDRIQLFDDLVEQWPDLTVEYQGQSVARRSLVQIRGFLRNAGALDLQTSMVEAPLTFQLPKGCKWLNARSEICNGDVEVEVACDENALVIKHDLWRRDEAFAIEALIEAEPTSAIVEGYRGGNSLEGFEFSHRIADTAEVEYKWGNKYRGGEKELVIGWRVTSFLTLTSFAYLLFLCWREGAFVPLAHLPYIGYIVVSGVAAFYFRREARDSMLYERLFESAHQPEYASKHR